MSNPQINPNPIDPTVDLVSENNSPNRKVVFASLASAIGTLLSIFLSTVLINSLPAIPDEDKGALKSSLAAAVTSIITLAAGYYTVPAAGDGTKKKDKDKPQ
jgi:hypothetical protein